MTAYRSRLLAFARAADAAGDGYRDLAADLRRKANEKRVESKVRSIKCRKRGGDGQ